MHQMTYLVIYSLFSDKQEMQFSRYQYLSIEVAHWPVELFIWRYLVTCLFH